MNWVVFCVLLGFALLNLLGVGIYHYEWKHADPHKDWHCKEFYWTTFYFLLVGTGYCLAKLIHWITEKCKKM